MRKRGSSAVWGLIIAVAAVSAIAGWYRLAGLPDFGMLLGPDLTVRSVAVEGGPTIDGQPVQRGDRLTAVAVSDVWMTVGDLHELSRVLPLLLADAESREVDTESLDGEEVPEVDRDRGVVLDYQLFRPVHRFSLVLQGEYLDPSELPPGVEPGDRLVEIDGRPQPEAWGEAGIRSVAANRPDAALGIERKDVYFFGQLLVGERSHLPGVLLSFLLVLAAVGALWRWHSDSVGAPAAYCIALETICLGWLFYLIFAHQWVLADHLLAAGVIVGLVMIRPLAILARQLGSRDGGLGGTISLGIGAVVSSVLALLMIVGYLPSPEEAIHAAAIVAGLFIIYELAATGMEGDSVLGLGERGGYMLGVVGLALFAAGVAALMEPVVFEEDRWRWFAVLVPSLMWFGDLMYGVKYGARSAMGEVADRRSRHELVWRYLREMALEMPHTELKLVVVVNGTAVELTSGKKEIEARLASDALADAVEILLNENARVPLPEGIDRQSHPMSGISKAMNISIAVALPAPEGSLMVGEKAFDVVLVGMREPSEGDIPSYASSETLDRAQELWSGPASSAAVIEALAALVSRGLRPVKTDELPESVERQLREAKEAALRCQEEKAAVVDERDEMARHLDETRRRALIREVAVQPVYPHPAVQRQLVEAELVEGLEFLLQEPVPIALAGALGAGKGFVAHLAHHLDGGAVEDFLMLDTGAPDAAERLEKLLGDSGGGQGPGLLGGFDGALLIRGAQRCDDTQLLTLCHQCEEQGVRLFLAFEGDDVEERSVFENRRSSLQELLGHREIVIPRFSSRAGIMDKVLDFWLVEWSLRYEKEVEAFSRMAAEALQQYDYPGQIAEAVEIVRLAVVDAAHDVVDRENLPLRVR